MTDTDHTRRRLLEIAEPVCSSAGYELVDIEYQREGAGWMVRIFIDRDLDVSHEAISFADCEAVSRELSAVFDVEDPVPQAYSLEVSSPGVERPLRSPAHFRRFVGETAKVVMASAIDGRKNFKGTLAGYDETHSCVLIEVDGAEFRLPIDSVRAAKLVADWDALMASAKADIKQQKSQSKASRTLPS